MIKNILTSFFIFINSCLLFADDRPEYKIIGNVPDSIDNIYVYLIPTWPSIEITDSKLDSTLINNGKFVFTGITDNQEKIYSIWTKDYEFINGNLIIEPGTILYNYQNDSIKGYGYASGTYLNDFFSDNILIPAMVMAKFGEDVMLGNINMMDPEIAEYITEMRSYSNKYYENVFKIMRENISNRLGEYLFIIHSYLIPETDLNFLLSNLSEEARQKYYEQKEGLNLAKVSIGDHYIPFSGIDTQNKLFHSTDIIGTSKVIILDFWASWCAPCLKEIPTMKELYKSYKDRGLEIIGISIDENELNWKKAIDKYDIPWINIISNKSGEDDIAQKYGISLIPSTILINKEGKIIDIDSRGEDLKEKIKALFH